MIGLILDHIWQSTLFAAVAGLLVFFFKDNSAKVRYGIWLSASLKFLFPLALLTAGGTALSALLPSQLPAPQIAAALDVATPVMAALDGASQPFSVDTSRIVQSTLAPAQAWDWGPVLALIWFAGFAWIVTLWLRRWLNLRAIVRSAIPVAINAPLPVKFSSSLLEPGLVGIFRPVLLLPSGITNRLSTSELDAIIAHEVCHWRRRDNLTAVMHMLVETLFWFHPLVWWLETRLIAERERACDEAVVATGRDPELYAESILKVCKFYVQSPLSCAAGVSGADLKRRLENIVRNKAALRLNFSRKAVLTTIAAIIIVAPLLAGVAASRQALAALAPVHPIASSIQVADNPVAQETPQANEPATTGADMAPDQHSRNGASSSETASALPSHPAGSNAIGRADYSQLGLRLAAVVESQVTTELQQLGNLWPVKPIARSSANSGETEVAAATAASASSDPMEALSRGGCQPAAIGTVTNVHADPQLFGTDIVLDANDGEEWDGRGWHGKEHAYVVFIPIGSVKNFPALDTYVGQKVVIWTLFNNGGTRTDFDEITMPPRLQLLSAALSNPKKTWCYLPPGKNL